MIVFHSPEIRVACDGFAMSANVNDAAITEDFEQDEQDVVCVVFTYDQTAFTFEKFFESCDEHIARAEVRKICISYNISNFLFY